MSDVITTLVNLERYPINDLTGDAAQALITTMRAELATSGACCIRDFISPEGIEILRNEAEGLAHLAFPGPTEATPYFFNYRIGEGKGYAENHPTRRTTPRRLAQVAGDLIPDDTSLRQLHQSSAMIAFLSAVLEESKFYPMLDKKQSLNISVMEEDGCQQWHFDRGRTVVTLLAQEAEDGGFFEYVPNIRSEQSENYDAVADVLDGKCDHVRVVKITAGTLMLFRGHYSLHRVTPVIGERKRLQLILAYSDNPNQLGSDASSELHYGAENAN